MGISTVWRLVVLFFTRPIAWADLEAVGSRLVGRLRDRKPDTPVFREFRPARREVAPFDPFHSSSVDVIEDDAETLPTEVKAAFGFST